MTNTTEHSDTELREELRQGNQHRAYADRMTPDGRENVEMIPLDWAVEIVSKRERTHARELYEEKADMARHIARLAEMCAEAAENHIAELTKPESKENV